MFTASIGLAVTAEEDTEDNDSYDENNRQRTDHNHGRSRELALCCSGILKLPQSEKVDSLIKRNGCTL